MSDFLFLLAGVGLIGLAAGLAHWWDQRSRWVTVIDPAQVLHGPDGTAIPDMSWQGGSYGPPYPEMQLRSAVYAFCNYTDPKRPQPNAERKMQAYRICLAFQSDQAILAYHDALFLRQRAAEVATPWVNGAVCEIIDGGRSDRKGKSNA